MRAQESAVSLIGDLMADIIKGKFKPSTSAERQFLAALKKVAKNAGHIVESHTDGLNLHNQEAMQKHLEDYAKLIEPWARRQSSKLLDQVSRSNKRAYQNNAKNMSKELKKQLSKHTFTGAMVRALQEEHVALIKSIPIESGRRAQEIALKAAIEGRRAVPDQSLINELKSQLGLSTEVATSRAQLIARTETAKASAMINQARAQDVGSTHYKWITSHDGAVRPSHKAMNNKIIAWDSPPTLSDGMTGHAGEFPNCRCYAEPILPEK